MGRSTDGQICFGFDFGEGHEFPWDSEEYEGDIVEWWRAVNGFKDKYKPFDESGEWAEGWSTDDPRMREHYGARREWDKENPIPIEQVNTCSGDYPMWILAIPGTATVARRGGPKRFDPSALKVDTGKYDAMIGFFNDHGIEPAGEPDWFLSSYWG